jgi:anti-sigma B factor antagonist
MEISINKEGKKLTLAAVGRIDTSTAPDFEKSITENVQGAEELVLDMQGVEYISSAGLRVILKAQKLMLSQGKMKVINISESVMEVFEITGFTDILTIE